MEQEDRGIVVHRMSGPAAAPRDRHARARRTGVALLLATTLFFAGTPALAFIQEFRIVAYA